MESFSAVLGEDRRSAATRATPTPTDAASLNDLFGHFPTIGEVEEYMIDQAMALAKGNQGIAAQMLGMGRQTLNKRLNKK